MAVVLVWVTLLNGTEGLRPGVGSVVPGSPAAVAGLRAGQGFQMTFLNSAAVSRDSMGL